MRFSDSSAEDRAKQLLLTLVAIAKFGSAGSQDVSTLVQHGYVTVTGDHVQLTPKGEQLVSDYRDLR